MALLRQFVASVPQLDIHTLSEEWALTFAMESTWSMFSESLGRPPSQWLDGQGARMYGAVMALDTSFDLSSPVLEDDEVEAETVLQAIRKPHAVSATRFRVRGEVRAETRILTSFVRRDTAGSNKKFSKVRDVWRAEDRDASAVDLWLDAHHAAKSLDLPDQHATTIEINRLQDFNLADFMYFRNFVRIARATEWRHGRGRPPQMAARRRAFFYGNVEDGEAVRCLTGEVSGAPCTALVAADGRLLFRSENLMQKVTIRPR